MKKYYLMNVICSLLFCFSSLGWAGDDGRVDIHGFISQGYLKTNHNNYMAATKDGTFQYNEMGINFSSQPASRLRIGVQFFARDLGEIGNDSITIDWAFADYRWKKWLGIQAGKIKSPKGLYYETRDFDILRTFVLLPQSVYTDNLRDDLIAFKGICAYGKINLGLAGDGYYNAICSQAQITEDSGAIKLLEDEGGFFITRNDPGFTSQLSLTFEPPIDGLKLGYTYIIASISFYGETANKSPWKDMKMSDIPITYDVTKNEYHFASCEYSLGDLILATELYLSSIDYKLSFDHPFHLFMDQKDNLTNMGYYGSACYRLNDLLEVGGYYSVFYRDNDDKDGSERKKMGAPRFQAWQKDTCLSIRANINSNWCAKIEGHYIDGTAQIQYQDNTNVQGDSDYKRYWSLFAAKVSYTF